jgi:hypothetical protein
MDEYIAEYNWNRTHQGKRCKGRTPMETFVEGKQLINEKSWSIDRWLRNFH